MAAQGQALGLHLKGSLSTAGGWSEWRGHWSRVQETCILTLALLCELVQINPPLWASVSPPTSCPSWLFQLLRAGTVCHYMSVQWLRQRGP